MLLAWPRVVFSEMKSLPAMADTVWPFMSSSATSISRGEERLADMQDVEALREKQLEGHHQKGRRRETDKHRGAAGALGRLDAGDELGHGGLAAAVRAGDDDHAFIDREAHVLEDLADSLVRLSLKAKVFEFKHWLVPSSLCFKSLYQKSSSSNLSDRSF